MAGFDVVIRIDERGEARVVSGKGAAPSGMPAPAADQVTRGTAKAEAERRIESQKHEALVQREMRAIQGPGRGAQGQLLREGAFKALNTMLDPLASGAGQQAGVARQAAFTSTMIGAQPGIKAAEALGGTAMGREAGAAAQRAAEAIAQSVDRLMQRRTMTEGQAVGTVQGVVGQMARAGVQVSDEDIDRMLSRQTAQNQLAYDAMVRVAGRSGNPLAESVGQVQAGVQNTLTSLGIGEEDQSRILEQLRQEEERKTQTERTTTSR
jgi:hypothetical protein